MDDTPTCTILLLGDPNCGKSTFFSKLSHGASSMRLQTTHLPLLRDLDQPFIYDIRMYNRPYRFEFYDTSSPENYTLLKPDFIVLCYDTSDRQSLVNMRDVWWVRAVKTFMNCEGEGEGKRGRGEDIPLMVLGLKRDLRVEGEGVIHPQEGHKFAQDLRCDMYAECSAVTGELMNEVIEDIARRAARTTTAGGGLTGGGCVVM